MNPVSGISHQQTRSHELNRHPRTGKPGCSNHFFRREITSAATPRPAKAKVPDSGTVVISNINPPTCPRKHRPTPPAPFNVPCKLPLISTVAVPISVKFATVGAIPGSPIVWALIPLTPLSPNTTYPPRPFPSHARSSAAYPLHRLSPGISLRLNPDDGGTSTSRLHRRNHREHGRFRNGVELDAYCATDSVILKSDKVESMVPLYSITPTSTMF